MAGLFYPAERRPVQDLIDRWRERQAKPERAVAVLVPHGAWASCGEVLGAVFSRLQWPKAAVILGPDHSCSESSCSLAAAGRWRTPLGEVSVDSPLARRILRAAPAIKKDRAGQPDEHSAEVLLPFLQRMGGIGRFVPITLEALADLETARHVAKGLAEALEGFGESVLLIASVNLTRYEPADVASRNDRGILERLMELDEEGLFRWVTEQRASLCGAAPAAAMAAASKALGASSGHLVKYEARASPTGHAPMVSGYAGMIFS